MKRYVLSLLAIGHTALGQAPDSTTFSGIPPASKFKFSFIGELGTTVASTSMPNIRSFFRSNQIEPDFHIDPMINFGFGARYGRLKLMLQAGNGISLIRIANVEMESVARQNSAGYSGVMLGFDVANTRNRRLYINAGFGSIDYEYSVYRRTNQAVSFQNILQTDRTGNIPSLRLRNNYLDVNIEYAQREKRKRGAESVLRLGFRRGLQARAWESDAFPLVGAPTDRISQFYFQGLYYFSSNYTKAGKR
ncbi:hypothetical protein BN8_04555 [Fibrisoma limi BUZ 3]|uniref:Outer membrane protein beta-barrel domain-containing protein n=1 Tax=Fibrisoma limi BUZ 3 TaxID=1185876 RepID=I2GN27_9BACT|nr:hypothetical protein [Fibrisoma limi]CCH55305.1 hypothetical protein BN8_04555 [Fibrisoma limi BUZ 3]